ncbi:MAG TPA: nuclear transport factor 2 family protein [Rhizobacter sp.]|nr:nuclear transport factor 2 family protein [Rhizobacter sp.]
MRLLRPLAALLIATALSACSTPPRPDLATLQRQVSDTETAFAATMAKRDHAGFTSFLADDTVFFSGPTPLRGKTAVADWWKRFYATPDAPFSWKPEKVEVLNNGSLAMTTGPVFDPSGKAVASFTSVWRREPNGSWKIIFDKGCNCPP